MSSTPSSFSVRFRQILQDSRSPDSASESAENCTPPARTAPQSTRWLTVVASCPMSLHAGPAALRRTGCHAQVRDVPCLTHRKRAVRKGIRGRTIAIPCWGVKVGLDASTPRQIAARPACGWPCFRHGIAGLARLISPSIRAGQVHRGGTGGSAVHAAIRSSFRATDHISVPLR